ncbi:MAG TPA: dockerin type I domain-containing protein [Pirellulales bacterium]|nr:dockerin type I domain-containing protein [Pirellulales bacterium]
MPRKPRVEELEPRLMFSVVSSPIPGDANQDNIVNTQDLAVVTSNWLRAGGGGLVGDVNGDGIVNAQDLAQISSSWLAAGPTLSPPAATAGVPLANAPVFHFTDDDPSSTANDYSAVITCGNGHTLTLTGTPSSNGQIVADSKGGFDVLMSYTYASPLSAQTFAVKVTDQGGKSAEASTANFSVGSGPPSVSLPAGPLTVKQTLDLPLSGMSVADGSLLSGTSNVQLALAAAHGTLVISTSVTGGLQSAQITGNGSATVTITAPLAAINATLAAVNGVIYTPTSGYAGADTLGVTISDLGNTATGTPQTVSRSVPINVTTGDVLPSDVPDLQLWLDPTDLSTLNLRTTAYLSGASQQYLHTAAGPNSFNFGTNNKFSFAGWVYFNNEAGDTFSSTQLIFSQIEKTGTNGVFSLSLSGSGYDSHLDFVVYAGPNNAKSVYTATGPGGSPFVSGHDYFIAVSFDGSQPTDGGKLSIWVDGTKLALANPNGNVLPSTLQNDTASTDQLILGNAFNTTNMSMRMEDWGVWDNVAFNQTDVNSLWAGGAGLTVTAVSQLPDNSGLGGSNLESPTMYWRLNETGGIRNDLSGHMWYLTPSSNDGSYVGSIQQVISWTDKSGVLGAFVAGDGPEATLQMKRMREPTYDPNALGPGRPGVVFGANQWLYNGVPNWMANSSTGAIFQNVLTGTSLAPAEDFFLSSSADTDTSVKSERIFMTGYEGASGDLAPNVYAPVLRINDTHGNSTGLGNGQPHAAIISMNYGAHAAFPGNYYMSTDQLLSFEWADVGSPGAGGLAAGPWRYYANGAPQQLYVSDGGAGNASGDWAELASGRSDQMLNGFYDYPSYQSFTQLGSTTTFGDVVAYGVAPTDNDGAQLRALMMQRAGLTGLLSPLPQTINTTATTYITSSAVTITGTTSTLIMPPVAAAKNLQVIITNNGSGAATLNADQGTDILPSGSTSGVSSLSLGPGQSATLVSDGTRWNVVSAAQSAPEAAMLATGASLPEDGTVPVDGVAADSTTSAEDILQTAILLPSVPWQASVAPVDRLAAFLGKTEPALPAAAVDSVMSQTPAVHSFALDRWTVGGPPRATRDVLQEAATTVGTSWTSPLDEGVLDSIAAATRGERS